MRFRLLSFVAFVSSPSIYFLSIPRTYLLHSLHFFFCYIHICKLSHVVLNVCLLKNTSVIRSFPFPYPVFCSLFIFFTFYLFRSYILSKNSYFLLYSFSLCCSWSSILLSYLPFSISHFLFLVPILHTLYLFSLLYSL